LKTSPLVSECRDVSEGIAKGDLNKVAINGGVIALTFVSVGGSAANAEVKIGMFN